MKNQLIRSICLVIGIILFNFLFWKEGFGINLLIFSLSTLGFSCYLYPDIVKKKTALLTGIGTLFCAVFVVVNHSTYSIVLYFLSYLAFIGFSFFKSNNQFLLAGILGLKNIFTSVFASIDLLDETISKKFPLKRLFYFAKLVIIPILVIGLFTLLYSLANEHFAFYSSKICNSISTFLAGHISFDRFFFFLLSFVLVSAILIPPKSYQKIIGFLPTLHKTIKRDRLDKSKNRGSQFLGLKKEYRMTQITLAGLNLIILFVNSIDFLTIWMGKTTAKDVNLKSFVHEGTYILIISILLAMGILLFAFRKNLNFFPKNKTLKILAIAWIAQNAFMVISVALRNFRYIEWHGLAYKRIGVIIFLLLVLFGLWTMFKKVKSKHSLQYLLYKNSIAAYLLLVVCVAINWDVAITKFNLNRTFNGPIDLQYMIYKMSDKNYRVLYEHKEKLDGISSYPNIDESVIDYGLENKANRIRNSAKLNTWLSWNYQDWKNRKWLRDN